MSIFLLLFSFFYYTGELRKLTGFYKLKVCGNPCCMYFIVMYSRGIVKHKSSKMHLLFYIDG